MWEKPGLREKPGLMGEVLYSVSMRALQKKTC